MAVVIDETESPPNSYPAAPAGLSSDASALESDAVWQRIESWITHRWTPRTVVYTVEGPGAWQSRLSPFTAATVEIWTPGYMWEALTPKPSPLGGFELEDHTYRIIGTAGDDSAPPAAVLEAFKRLAEYSVDQTAGATSHSVNAFELTESYDRSAQFLARAMSYSGAADLLRPYRKVN